jgi:hypothetical protein
MRETPRTQADRRAFEQRDCLLVFFMGLLLQSNEIGAGLSAIRELGLHKVHRRYRTVGYATSAPCRFGGRSTR